MCFIDPGTRCGGCWVDAGLLRNAPDVIQALCSNIEVPGQARDAPFKVRHVSVGWRLRG